MNREDEEAVLRITAQYVTEQQAGHQPRLSDYLFRYPQYAGAITDFVAYYHAVEADLPGEMFVAGEEFSQVSVLPPLSNRSRAALDQAWKRLAPTGELPSNAIMTMQQALSKQQTSLSQLAGEVGLSVELMEKLARRMIDAATIPQELLQRLSRALKLPQHVTLDFSGLSAGKSPMRGVAEAAENYSLAERHHRESFREALEGSIELSNEQKKMWYEILDTEGL
ncbi:MAG TPA: hypothetical protein VJ761_14555 [Ktedonobacteraceae bacterium]|nr:hypothetical protein [Ktedonobacteraceae bacterium]